LLAQSYLNALFQTLDQISAHPFRPRIADVLLISPPPEVGNVPVTAPVVLGQQVGIDLTPLLRRAHGGVLILSANDLLVTLGQSTGAWAALREALLTQQLTLRGTVAPPIPLAVKVAVVGSFAQWNVLVEAAPDFAHLFRYRAFLEPRVPWSQEGEAVYAALADGLAAQDQLPSPDPSAVAALIETGARRVESRRYLSTNITRLHDLVREAGHLVLSATRTASSGDVVISRREVEDVFARRQYEQGYFAQVELQRILEGRQLVPTDGDEVGAITGLWADLELPEESWHGGPSRHSATIGPGREERLIDVEREADAADKSHIEGALTMIGFLTWRYGHDVPISLVARLRGEQRQQANGGSASAAELFMLLSALADVPIWRCRAVTGQVGQHGDIQAIGGVNQKIEGFWRLCRARWNAGEHPNQGFGVLIPVANVDDLMLPREVAQDIAEQGWFTIWPISTLDEALPLLTGWTADEIHSRVARRLHAFYDIAARLHT
jgi:predicted ATP-dependent protease